VNEAALRVGLDLDGSLESLSNSMVDLATALSERGDLELVRFRTLSAPQSSDEVRLALRWFWAPWWRRSRGRALDSLLSPLDVIHVAGLATPPTTRVPLLISVDDLRPLRSRESSHQRVVQLQRAVARGAVLVVSSRAARHEVMAAMGLSRPEIVVVRPPVGHVEPTRGGTALVVSVTGLSERFDALAKDLQSFVDRHHTRLMVIASTGVGQRVRASGIDATIVERRNAASALAQARCVVHISDGARFPSFAVAALAAGVPTLTRATAINRELLSGAAALIHDDDEAMGELEDLWSNESRRAILIAAGLARSADFSPWTVASAYASLYADVARRSRV
jgi:glycosyltransferase involved in cell wall biosynthesis